MSVGRARVGRAKGLRRKVLLLLSLAGAARPAVAQQPDSTARHVDVSGALSITTKGISTIPSFTLGKPAAILDVAIRNGRLGFEPQFRFGLDGKPWSFLFWSRYRPLTGGKFHLTLGGHPAFAFRTISVSTAGVQRDLIQVRRYLAADATPTYVLTNKVSVGAYYLYSHGIEKDAARHTHFIAARVNLTNLRIADRYSVQIAPQLYYLRTDGQDGVYFSSSITLARQNFPVSISSMVNNPIRSTVAGGQQFLWNVTVNYAIQ